MSDASSYVYDDPEEDEPNAALFSKDDLSIYGNGSLTVHGNYNGALDHGSFIITGGLLVAAGSAGEQVLSFSPAKTYQALVFSSPALTGGTTCDIYQGGAMSGTVSNGLLEEGTYSPGTKYASFTVSSINTIVY